MARNSRCGVALVTGATGFIGSHLVRRLVSDGWSVHILTRPKSSLLGFADIEEELTAHSHDGSTEQAIGVMAEAKPTVVFHLASLFLAQHTPDQLQDLIRSNVLFSAQIVEAMCQVGCFHLVNTGTSWQHFEGKSYSPVCLYAATKQAFETILEFYVETTPLRVVTLKLFDTYGPLDPRRKLFRMLSESAAAKTELLMSAGEQLLDLVYIDDVINAFLAAGQTVFDPSESKFRSYAVTSGKPLSLREVVDVYNSVAEDRVRVVWGGRPYRDREVMIPWSGGNSIPGWEPTVSLHDGLLRCEAARQLAVQQT